MQTKVLRVRAHGDASVPNYERLDQGVNCFIGRVFTELEPGRWGFVPTTDIVEVPSRAEYLKAIRDGDLVPADGETARAAGMKYEGPPRPKSNAPPPMHDEPARADHFKGDDR